MIGLINGKFMLSVGSTVQMKFPCSSLLYTSNATVHSSSVWLFPRLGEDIAFEGDAVDATFKVSVFSATQKSSQRVAVNSWNKEEQCMSLDITTALKKYVIKRGNSTEQECTVSIEVTNVEVSVTDIVSRSSNCEDFSGRTCSTPFLVMKYFDFKSEPEMQQGAGEERAKRALKRPNATDDEPCSKVDLWVNLTSLSFILYPKTINVGACDGSCEGDNLTIRQSLLNTVRQSLPNTVHQPLPNATTSTNQENLLDLSLCCTNDELSPVVVLLKHNSDFVIESIPDIIVKSCKCRE